MLALSHTGTLWIRHIPQSTRIIVPSRTIGITSQQLLIFFKTFPRFQSLCFVSFLSNLPFLHYSIAHLDSSSSQILPSHNTVFSASNYNLVIHFVFFPLWTAFSSEPPSPCDCFAMIKCYLYMQHHCLFKVTPVQNTFELSIHLCILLSVFGKKFNVILLTLQYHLVQTMPFHLTIAILLSANMQSLQTMPVLNASRHWPILQWQTILASLSQTTPILQFHSSSSKIPFFPKFMVFSNLLSSSNPLAMNPPFSGQHVCCTSPFFSRLQTIH